MSHRFLSLLLAGLVVGTALPCRADMSSEDRAKRWFQERDRDHAGYITADEVVSYELKRFKRMDATGEGKLSLAEFCSGVPSDQFEEVSRCRGLFLAIDSNGDGLLTPEELTSYYRDAIHKADQNGDGHVTLEEWLASKQDE